MFSFCRILIILFYVFISIISYDLSNRLLPNRGVLVVPCLVFPVCRAEVLPALARVLSATCAAVVVCSAPPRSGATGIKRSV